VSLGIGSGHELAGSLFPIKPIETVYKGYRFGSRLEALWAAFYDLAGVSYHHEMDPIDVGGEAYPRISWCRLQRLSRGQNWNHMRTTTEATSACSRNGVGQSRLGRIAQGSAIRHSRRGHMELSPIEI
jgi:hypothetical protein